MTHLHALAKLARLMSPESANHLNPLRLIKSNAVLEGTLSTTDLQRLQGYLHDNSGSIHYRYQFGVDDRGYQCVEANIKADLQLICQRCLGGIKRSVESANKLALVHSIEEANQLPDEYDPLIIEGDEISLPVLIEDEVLLAIPISPTHAINECPVKLEKQSLETEKANPFAALNKLQTQKQE